MSATRDERLKLVRDLFRMGTIGAGLYASDLAIEARSCLRPLLRADADGDFMAEHVAAAFDRTAIDAGDEEHAELWIVLAVTLHRAGVNAPRTRKRASELFGADLDAWKRRGATGSDLAERAKVLDAVARELRAVLPARKGKVLERPEALRTSPGDVLALAPASFAPANMSYDRSLWPPDRHVGVVTLAAAHVAGTLGICAVALLDLGRGTPRFADVASAPLLHARLVDAVGPVLSLCWVSPWPKKGLTALGRLELRDPLPAWIELSTILARLDRGRTFAELAMILLWLDAAEPNGATAAELLRFPQPTSAR